MPEQEIRICGVTYKELLDGFRKVVHDEVREALQSSAPAEDNSHPYTVVETAKFLNCTRQTVHEYVRAGRLRVHKLGARSYFFKADIMAALQNESYQRTPKASRHARR
ncbi:helix-turn-helix domain-containing protein [Hymenobacter arizonensis]|uniref:DNA binding domain-containing protein, excisionase family n=1 Tax=Hymenobacter arizonensis TaxID=1227077 RepID=A0A1I5YZ18_HYMAR|nr:helix-turn-helix domain-containing protein [Hymenobacter arizonensis]SFQ49494.1 DNA binding domain-containing protein, excisionase family [Hymenobacter arizonensis]